MTADAKVGLLLGLFFIVIIAFLVNGLDFLRTGESTAVTNTIGQPRHTDRIPGERVGEWVERRYDPRPEPRRTIPPREEVALEESGNPQPPQEVPNNTPLHRSPEVVRTDELTDQPTAPQPARAHIHEVKSGEILPVIAKKYYGDEQGNRRIVIQKLYELNKDVLKSPDNVRVGDKLQIPATVEMLLGQSVSGNTNSPEAPSRGVFGTIADMFDRVGSDASATPAPAPAAAREYVVKSGDSLWAIAESLLGNGNRYKAILKLNRDKIASPDNLPEGLRLRIPSE